MAKLLFKLRFVPEDEAQDIRELLSENGIDYYETSAGILGISMPALWLKDDSQLEAARSLIDQYQEQRLQRARQENQQPRSMIDLFRENPPRFIGYIVAILLLVYFTVVIFFNLGR